MKYIVTENEEGEREIFVFPRSVPHNAFAEVVAGIRNQTHGNWRRIRRKPVSAGFVDGGRCHGRSESLHLKSRPEDTELLGLSNETSSATGGAQPVSKS